MVQSKPKGKSSFTPEQKEQYKAQKESEKQELQALYNNFMEKKTIKDFIGIVANYKQMHNYSLRNLCLVMAQAEKRNNTKFVGILNGFVNWKKQDIQVLRGSKGYKILIPMFKKKESEEKETNTDEDKKEKTLTFFKIGNVFDISQTSEYESYLEEQKEINEKIMKNSEIDYNTALNFVSTHFPKVKIIEEFKDQEKKGSYDPLSHKITLYQGSSHTLYHEIGHFLTISVLKIAGDITKDYAKNEVLAELSSYLLLKKFDEAITYNFAYSNVWANRITNIFELEEFEKIFKIISKYITTLKVSEENEKKKYDGL
jgi:hypothetical protein